MASPLALGSHSLWDAVWAGVATLPLRLGVLGEERPLDLSSENWDLSYGFVGVKSK
jgi:hypothetical protein